MKLFLAIFFLLFVRFGFSQNGAIRAIITRSDSLSYDKLVFVILSSADREVFSGYQPFDQPVLFDALTPKIYKLSIKVIGQRSVSIDSLAVDAGKTLELNLLYPGPCPYMLAAGSKPSCIGGHSDNIVPVVYGFPGPSATRKAKNGKIYLAGCESTGCDPKFYCRMHKRLL